MLNTFKFDLIDLDNAVDKKLKAKFFNLFSVFIMQRNCVYMLFRSKYDELASKGGQLGTSRTAFESWVGEKPKSGKYCHVHSDKARMALWTYQMIEKDQGPVPPSAMQWQKTLFEVPEFSLLIALAEWEDSLPAKRGRWTGTGVGGVRGSDNWETTIIRENDPGLLKFRSGELSQLVANSCCKMEIFWRKWENRDSKSYRRVRLALSLEGAKGVLKQCLEEHTRNIEADEKVNAKERADSMSSQSSCLFLPQTTAAADTVQTDGTGTFGSAASSFVDLGHTLTDGNSLFSVHPASQSGNPFNCSVQ